MCMLKEWIRCNYPHAKNLNQMEHGCLSLQIKMIGVGKTLICSIWQFKLTTPWDSTTLVCEKIYEVDITDSGLDPCS